MPSKLAVQNLLLDMPWRELINNLSPKLLGLGAMEDEAQTHDALQDEAIKLLELGKEKN